MYAFPFLQLRCLCDRSYIWSHLHNVWSEVPSLELHFHHMLSLLVLIFATLPVCIPASFLLFLHFLGVTQHLPSQSKNMHVRMTGDYKLIVGSIERVNGCRLLAWWWTGSLSGGLPRPSPEDSWTGWNDCRKQSCFWATKGLSGIFPHVNPENVILWYLKVPHLFLWTGIKILSLKSVYNTLSKILFHMFTHIVKACMFNLKCTQIQTYIPMFHMLTSCNHCD